MSEAKLIDDDEQIALRAGEVIRTLRKNARLTATETASLMGVSRRVYQGFESGDDRLSPRLIFLFAEATQTDPIGIILAILIGDSRFASRVADTKIMTMMFLAIQEWNEGAGDDIALVSPNEFFSIVRATLTKVTEIEKSKPDLVERIHEHRFPRLPFSFLVRLMKKGGR